MSQPPRTPSEWLVFMAELADKHPIETITSAGDGLQMSLVSFLLEAGRSGADLTDLQADLATLLPRFSNALIQSEHAGGPCMSCAARFVSLAGGEILTDMRRIAERSKTGGIH